VTRAVLNPYIDRAAVARPSTDARSFHEGLPGYRPTPVHDLDAVADDLGLSAVGLKDETDRLGLPAFKILGASWAVERTLRSRPKVRTLVAASAGNHGRAVARVAALRGLRAEVFLPERAGAARREAIEAEGAEVVVVDGDYEAAVRRASAETSRPDVAEIADVGDSPTAHWVIDGYATLFSELRDTWDAVIVPAGVGSLAAAAARHAAATGARVICVEPATAGCVTASLEAGRPVAVRTPGTAMAGMDCGEVSPAAWPTLRAGIHASVTVTDDQVVESLRTLHGRGLRVGHCGAAPLAALRYGLSDDDGKPLRRALGISETTRVLLLATEGVTDPELLATLDP
jgi:diaminopropionate ammonia-lyase